MQLGRDWIENHIPHRYEMCLLDSVVAWDDESIHCEATSHREPSNPLRAHGRLAAVCAIEYAAQTMAVHGSLLAHRTLGRSGSQGFLTGIRRVRLFIDRLDTVTARLDCKATRITGDSFGILYTFEVSADGNVLAVGRATVILDASKVVAAESALLKFDNATGATSSSEGESM